MFEINRIVSVLLVYVIIFVVFPFWKEERRGNFGFIFHQSCNRCPVLVSVQFIYCDSLLLVIWFGFTICIWLIFVSSFSCWVICSSHVIVLVIVLLYQWFFLFCDHVPYSPYAPCHETVQLMLSVVCDIWRAKERSKKKAGEMSRSLYCSSENIIIALVIRSESPDSTTRGKDQECPSCVWWVQAIFSHILHGMQIE